MVYNVYRLIISIWIINQGGSQFVCQQPKPLQVANISNSYDLIRLQSKGTIIGTISA